MADLPSIPRASFGQPQARERGLPDPSRTVPTSPDLVVDSVVSRPLAQLMAESTPRATIGVVIELRSSHPEGVAGAAADVMRWLSDIAPKAAVRRGQSSVSNYVAAGLTASQIRQLVQADNKADVRSKELTLGVAGSPATAPTAAGSRPAPRYAIDRMWPNFEIHNLIHRSVVTTKSDAAQRAFEATGEGVVWAVLDSGIQADHLHFALHRNTDLPGQLKHMDFTDGSSDPLVDEAGHGTHVAGILAGEQVASPGTKLVAATWYQEDGAGLSGARVELDHVRGMAPRTKLLSCKVLRGDGSGDVTALLDALEYISDLNKGGRELNVHGVNLSVGYPFDPSWFGTGLTPVCREVDRLVRSGVLVVVAAGNSGYGIALDAVAGGNPQMHLGFAMTINDPGNADRALTVGSTSVRPHLSGVSYFSSKGPTGDGRMKPDLVAPGERIVSAGAGALLQRALQRDKDATYVEDSGTSMAAPHVSGVAAGLLSVNREFIGRPEEVKRILMDTATDLGRVPTFQGKGLVDSMRAIQSV
jgi:serine protease AprX